MQQQKQFTIEDAPALIDAGFIPGGVPGGILAGFFEFCNTQGLNPWKKEAFITAYYNRDKGGNEYAYIAHYSHLLKIAQRSGTWAGMNAVRYNERTASDGRIVFDTMADLIAAKKTPLTAHVTVYKIIGGQRFPFNASVACGEYIKTNKEGKPSGTWARMLYTMIEKVVVSRAVRMTWPVETDGLRIEEEVQAMSGDTDSADLLNDTNAIATPKGRDAGVAPKKDADFPLQGDEARERAELLETVAGQIAECGDDIAALNGVYKNNQHWCVGDDEVIAMFKEAKAIILKKQQANEQ